MRKTAKRRSPAGEIGDQLGALWELAPRLSPGVYVWTGRICALLGLYWLIDPSVGNSQIANMHNMMLGLGFIIFGTGGQIIGAIMAGQSESRRSGAVRREIDAVYESMGR